MLHPGLRPKANCEEETIPKATTADVLRPCKIKAYNTMEELSGRKDGALLHRTILVEFAITSLISNLKAKLGMTNTETNLSYRIARRAG